MHTTTSAVGLHTHIYIIHNLLYIISYIAISPPYGQVLNGVHMADVSLV